MNSTIPQLDRIPGWFEVLDRQIFAWLLESQIHERMTGDLLEMGTFMGKSAIELGRHLRDADELIVCDLFGSRAPDMANQDEVDQYYGTLRLQDFQRNYRTFHDRLPRIIHGPTERLRTEVARHSCRFVHIDASHLYRQVREDIDIAQSLLVRRNGVVAIDDYRSAHTPGVARAVWRAVLQGGLRPIFLTPRKFYGTWDDPRSTQDRLIAYVRGRPDVTLGVDGVDDDRLFHLRPEQRADGAV